MKHVRSVLLAAMLIVGLVAGAGLTTAGATQAQMAQPTDDSDASVVFENQTVVDGTLTVQSATLPEGGFVAIHQTPGNVIGSSEYLEPGTHESVEVEIDAELTDQMGVGAAVHQDTNGNQAFDFTGMNSAIDFPYMAVQEPVNDRALLQLADESDASDNETDDEEPAETDDQTGDDESDTSDNETDDEEPDAPEDDETDGVTDEAGNETGDEEPAAPDNETDDEEPAAPDNETDDEEPDAPGDETDGDESEDSESDDSETDGDESEDSESDDSETDGDESEDSESDDSETDGDESEDSESDDNESDDEADEVDGEDGVTMADEVNVVLDGAPNGLQTYSVTLELDESANATVQDVEAGMLPDSKIQVVEQSDTSITFRAADLSDAVGAFEDARSLGTVNLSERTDAADVSVSVESLIADDGSEIDASAVSFQMVGDLFTEPLPGSAADAPPMDLDGDGLYEDVNGDGSANFDDAITLAFVEHDTLSEDQQAALDFNQDEQLSFGDAIELAFLV